MACPVSHIIYADKYLEKYPSREINPDEFILGCCFPDIRRIDSGIKRKETHLCFSEIDLNFKGLSSFQAGWKFHLYCDMKREEILNKHDFYSMEHTTDFWNGSAKFLEDELIYGEYDNWEKTVHYFNNPPEIGTGIAVPPARNATNSESELIHYLSTTKNKTVDYHGHIVAGGRETFELWYAILGKYFEKNPDSKTIKIFLSKQPSLADKAGDIVAAIDKLRKNDRVVGLLRKVNEEII